MVTYLADSRASSGRTSEKHEAGTLVELVSVSVIGLISLAGVVRRSLQRLILVDRDGLGWDGSSLTATDDLHIGGYVPSIVVIYRNVGIALGAGSSLVHWFCAVKGDKHGRWEQWSRLNAQT